MEQKVIKFVKDYLKERYPDIIDENLIIFVVWSCYILRNRKFLVGCNVNNLYFEVTYNANKEEWYLDVYKKEENIIIND